MRNPDWTRDELILALDVYMRRRGASFDAEDPDVVGLSKLLRSLHIHGGLHGPKFRNPNGIVHKLGNLRYLDPAHPGGFEHGAKLDKVVWNEFAGNPPLLHSRAEAIRSLGKLLPPTSTDPLEELDEDNGSPEGRTAMRLHRERERDRGLVRRKKRQRLQKTGKLACEVCGFDFEATYGDIGHAFAECHHKTPLAELATVTKTRLADLAIVCANCHRMLHRRSPMNPNQLISISELQHTMRRHRVGPS